MAGELGALMGVACSVMFCPSGKSEQDHIGKQQLVGLLVDCECCISVMIIELCQDRGCLCPVAYADRLLKMMITGFPYILLIFLNLIILMCMLMIIFRSRS